MMSRLLSWFVLVLTVGVVLTFGARADIPAPEPETRVVIIHRPGPAWDASKPYLEQAGLQAHIDHYRKLLTDGQLELGGPFIDAGGGGMMISVAGASLEELTTYANEDPTVVSGLLTVDVRSWMIGMHR